MLWAGNTCAVDDMLYDVDTHSVGDILWVSRPCVVGNICCGYVMWASRPYAVDNMCCGYILSPWTSRLYAVETHAVGTTVGTWCGNHNHMLWATYGVGGYIMWASRPHAVHNMCCGYILWASRLYVVETYVVGT